MKSLSAPSLLLRLCSDSQTNIASIFPAFCVNFPVLAPALPRRHRVAHHVLVIVGLACLVRRGPDDPAVSPDRHPIPLMSLDPNPVFFCHINHLFLSVFSGHHSSLVSPLPDGFPRTIIEL